MSSRCVCATRRQLAVNCCVNLTGDGITRFLRALPAAAGGLSRLELAGLPELSGCYLPYSLLSPPSVPPSPFSATPPPPALPPPSALYAAAGTLVPPFCELITSRATSCRGSAARHTVWAMFCHEVSTARETLRSPRLNPFDSVGAPFSALILCSGGGCCGRGHIPGARATGGLRRNLQPACKRDPKSATSRSIPFCLSGSSPNDSSIAGLLGL